jgi:DNA polymerase-3 subunit delta
MSECRLFLGPEQGDKKRELEELKARLIRQHGDVEVHKLYPFEVSVPEMVALLRNGSLFSSHKLVIVDQAEELPATGDITQLTEYLASPSPDSTLVFLSLKTNLDNRKLEAAIPAASKKIFWELFEAEKSTWLIRFFRERDRILSPDAAESLLELIANNTEEMKSACEKLCFYYPPGHTISADEIDEVVYHSREESVYTLFERMALRDTDGALEILASLILANEAEPVPTLAGLVWQFQKLADFKLIVERTGQFQTGFQELAIKSKKAQKIHTGAARVYTLKELQSIISLLADADREARTSGKPLHGEILNMLVFRATTIKVT